MKNDELGERIKDQYELRTRYLLPRRTYTVIRVDGKAFHTLTKGFVRPFDSDLMKIMNETAIAMCRQIQGACLGYVQSDEISIILTDFATPQTDAWFDGNVQKIASVSASMATAAFNKLMANKALDQYMLDGFTKGKFYGYAKDERDREPKMAFFDSRVFTIPDVTEVFNYLIWRQQDASRNSIQASAQALYNQKELHGKNTSELQEMIFQKGINWNDYTSGEKRGRAIVKETLSVTLKETGYEGPEGQMVTRSKWVAYDSTKNETPLFTADKEFLSSRIPLIGAKNED